MEIAYRLCSTKNLRGTIKKISKHFDKKTLLILYNSLIISHIRYCITTWHIGNKTTASKIIQRIANKLIRLTFGLHHRANVTDILRNNNIMTIDQITELEITCFMYKYIKGMLPPCFDHFFKNNLVSDNFSKCTSQSKFYPSFCRLNISKQSYTEVLLLGIKSHQALNRYYHIVNFVQNFKSTL